MSERHTSLCDEMRDHQYGCICGAWDGKEPSNAEFAQHLAAANHSESPNSCRDCATLAHRAEEAERALQDLHESYLYEACTPHVIAANEAEDVAELAMSAGLAECERERESAALWRERCNNAEARSDAVTTELRRIYSAICRGQTRSDDHHAVAQAVIDEYHDVQRERDEQSDRIDTLVQRHEADEAYRQRMEQSRSLCIEALRGVQATGDVDAQTWDVVADGIRALWARLDTRDEWAEEDGRAIAHREFMAAGWRRLARHYQSCHLAGHACLRETHRAKGEQIAALRRARDDDAAYRSDLMEQCDTLRAQVREAATARDAALANADAVLSTAEAMRVERDRMRDYWRSEAEMRGACLVEIDQLRAKLARAEGVVQSLNGDIESALTSRRLGLHVPHELDAVPVSALRHIQRQVKAALATYEEG